MVIKKKTFAASLMLGSMVTSSYAITDELIHTWNINNISGTQNHPTPFTIPEGRTLTRLVVNPLDGGQWGFTIYSDGTYPTFNPANDRTQFNVPSGSPMDITNNVHPFSPATHVNQLDGTLTLQYYNKHSTTSVLSLQVFAELMATIDRVSLQQAFEVQDLTPKLTNVTLNGAHHRLLMDTAPGEGGWNVWTTGDYADYNDIDSTQSIGEVGFSKSLYEDTLRLGLGLGYNNADQDAAFGGGSKIDGEFLALEGNYRIPDSSLIFSSLLYYGNFDAETSRGYLLGGAPSIGETDIESLAFRLRLDWKDAWTVGKVSVTPRISYTYIDTVADAYTETGGVSPASFAKQRSKDHEFRLGTDFDVALNATTRLRTVLEAVYRENDDDSLRGTSGGSAFNFANEDLNDFWGRLGFEVVHELADSTNLHASVFGSTEGDDPTFSASIGINVAF